MISQPPLLSVIIVSYNTRGMTMECLRTLYPEINGITSEVWVVDNASTDGTVAEIEREFPQVRLIANSVNEGFGAANNQAMSRARGKFFLLLNSDAFPKPGAVRSLLDYIEKHPSVGAVGPRLLNASGSLQVSCFRFPSPAYAWMENLWLSGGYRGWKHDSLRQVDFVIGACMLVRREVFGRVGGFDERFFMYSEETDWQRRIHDAGWDIVFVPESRFIHLGSASGAKNGAQINRHFFESLDVYVKKHHGMAGLISLRAAMAVGCLTRSILWTASAALPKRRELAMVKARHHAQLFVRQTTHWSLGK